MISPIFWAMYSISCGVIGPSPCTMNPVRFFCTKWMQALWQFSTERPVPLQDPSATIPCAEDRHQVPGRHDAHSQQ